MFRRETDWFIKKALGQQPLDVGTDRIARTAYAASKILGELQLSIKKEIELVWDPDKLNRFSVIEVYPAATLQCYEIQSVGYKGVDVYPPSLTEDDIAHLFKRFYTCNKARNQESTGIGLYIVKVLLERMSGKNIATSLINHVFTLKIAF